MRRAQQPIELTAEEWDVAKRQLAEAPLRNPLKRNRLLAGRVRQRARKLLREQGMGTKATAPPALPDDDDDDDELWPSGATWHA